MLRHLVHSLLSLILWTENRNHVLLNFHDIHLVREKSITENTIWGYKLCVGTPESFALMQNVILENVRTAEHMLIGYEHIMRGETKSLDIIAYDHGDAGRKQFKKNKHRFISKK